MYRQRKLPPPIVHMVTLFHNASIWNVTLYIFQLPRCKHYSFYSFLAQWYFKNKKIKHNVNTDMSITYVSKWESEKKMLRLFTTAQSAPLWRRKCFMQSAPFNFLLYLSGIAWCCQDSWDYSIIQASIKFVIHAMERRLLYSIDYKIILPFFSEDFFFVL